MSKTLQIKDLHVSVDGNEILKGIDLTINTGEIHCIMGPNGSGKSTLANVVMGHPAYEITKGEILFDGKLLGELEAFERARLGLFLAFQYPKEISGLSVLNFLTASYNAHLLARDSEAKPIKSFKFRERILEEMEKLKINPEFLERFLNHGFSGGEKKKAEILQLKLLKPAIALLDETDSGLDVDALKIVAAAVNEMRGADFGALIVTHYQRILDYIEPDFVHVMKKGKIVKSGDREFAKELEKRGYEWIVAD